MGTEIQRADHHPGLIEDRMFPHPRHDEAYKAIREGLEAAGFDIAGLPSLVHRLVHDLSEYVSNGGQVDIRFWQDMQDFASRHAGRVSRREE